MIRRNEDNTPRNQFEKLERAFREQSLGASKIEEIASIKVPADIERTRHGSGGEKICGNTPEAQKTTGEEIYKLQEGDGIRARRLAVVTDYRLRLLDYDNLCAKPIIDCIRYAGLIPEDNPENLEILVRQKKITDPKQIRLEIEIVRIEPNWTIDTMFELPELIARLMLNDLTVLQDLKKIMTP